MDIFEKIKKLREVLNEHNKRYYVYNDPIIDDSEFDKLLKELKDLEEKNPELITEDSPTQLVGKALDDNFEKYKHKFQMLSLANAFSKDDLVQFSNHISKLVDKSFSYFVEPKIDGLSISLIYKKGVLEKAVTRGDGVIGEIVTNNVKTIKTIPKKINNNDDYFEVRGEVYLSKSDFDKINHKKVQSNEKIFANPRNAASGTLRQLDVNIVAERNLDCWIYYYLGEQNFKTHSESLNYLKELGFPINPISKNKKTINETFDMINEIIEMRDSLEYEIDGAVIKVDEVELHEQIGYTSKVPKWAIAYKFPAEIKTTKLLDIIPTLGRTGKITYNAVLKPVKIAGTIVKAATLHNYDFITGKDIRVGSNVRIKKAGDIIPEIIESIRDENFNKLNKFQMILNCPSCNSTLQSNEDEVDQFCLNNECIGKKIRGMEHFVSRAAMNIDGLSEKIIYKLYSNKFINDISDIYDLENKREELTALDKMGEKLVDNLINSINKSKSNSGELFLFGLGIRYVGKKAAKTLLTKFDDIEELRKKSIDELLLVNEIGPSLANSVVSWFSNSDNLSLYNKLISKGINTKYKSEIIKIKNEYVEDKKFVITGTLSKPRKYFADLIESNGGIILNTVTSKTDILLCGSEPGSKLEKANKLGIEVMDEEKFDRIIKR